MLDQVVADLGNPNKFEVVYQDYKESPVPAFPRQDVWIEPWEFPILFDRFIYVIWAQTYRKKDNWYRAGYLYQQIANSITPEGVIEAQKFWVPLDRPTLLVFPKVAPQFQMKFAPAPWLLDIIVSLYEYRGEETTREEDLIQAVRVDLARIEFKVDQL